MDASYKIQRGIHVHLIQFFMCPEFWVHITDGSAASAFWYASPCPKARRGSSTRFYSVLTLTGKQI